VTSEGAEVAILPPRQPQEPQYKGRSVYLSEEMWSLLTEISEVSKQEDPHGKGYSRNEVITEFLTWAIRQWQSEREKGGPISKKVRK